MTRSPGTVDCGLHLDQSTFGASLISAFRFDAFDRSRPRLCKNSPRQKTRAQFFEQSDDRQNGPPRSTVRQPPLRMKLLSNSVRRRFHTASTHCGPIAVFSLGRCYARGMNRWLIILVAIFALITGSVVWAKFGPLDERTAMLVRQPHGSIAEGAKLGVHVGDT